MKIVLLIFVTVFIYSCQPKECRDFNLPHDFEIPLQVTPTKNQFMVGDTLNVEVVFNNRQAYDVNLEKSFDISEFEIFPSSWFTQIDTLPVISGFDNNPVLVNDDFNPRFVEHSTITTTLSLRFVEEGENLILSYQILLNHLGTYCLLNCPDLYKAPKFKGKCNSSHSTVHFKIVIPFPNRRDLLESCQDDDLRQELNNDFDLCAGFCFEVR